MAAVSRSAKFYKSNTKARNKKKAYDTKLNERPEQVKKRVEANRARRKAKKNGTNVTGKDMSHTKNGMVAKKTSTNRGSKSDSAGDKRARGGSKTKKKK